MPDSRTDSASLVGNLSPCLKSYGVEVQYFPKRKPGTFDIVYEWLAFIVVDDFGNEVTLSSVSYRHALRFMFEGLA